MSPNQRLQQFHNQVITNKSLPRKHPSYRRRFMGLVALRYSAEFLLITGLIYIGQLFWLQNAGFISVWPFMGVAVAALYLRGNAALLGIAAGIVLSFLMARLPFLVGASVAALFVLFVFSLRFVGRCWLGPIAPLAERKILIKWCLLVFIGSLITAALFLTILHYFALMQITPWIFAATFLGMFNGILCLAPLCLAFDPFTLSTLCRKSAYRIAAIFIGVVLLPLPLFFIPESFALAWMVFLGLILHLIARTLGFIATAVSSLLLAISFMIASLPGLHLFQASYSIPFSLTLLTFFTALILSALILSQNQK